MGIILPEPYRTFVAEIASGMSWRPLHTTASSRPVTVATGMTPSRRRPVSRLPFPLNITKGWIWEGGRPRAS
ncbi:hypothetical protein EMPG_14603 [Blastomyces silverae]|uniref:Uncharacterized protein n=1 Tax=Blastomyces silverae TaxID=2060906 RepID=A0A0H1BFV6_9EURO|nr:hypothetical protein EMPG_14603 [Blastomyces silverae]